MTCVQSAGRLADCSGACRLLLTTPARQRVGEWVPSRWVSAARHREASKPGHDTSIGPFSGATTVECAHVTLWQEVTLLHDHGAPLAPRTTSGFVRGNCWERIRIGNVRARFSMAARGKYQQFPRTEPEVVGGDAPGS